MLGKIFIALFWLAFAAEIFHAVDCCKKFFGSAKIRNREPESSTIVCSVTASAATILLMMFFVFASKDTKEALRSDSFLKYLAIPINQIALISFMFIGIFSYYMEKQIKHAKPSATIEIGDLSDFEDYRPIQRTKEPYQTNGFDQLSANNQTTITEQIKETNRTTNHPRHNISPRNVNTDNGTAILYIMQLNGKIDAQGSFNTLSEAKDYAEQLDFGNIIIRSGNTLIFSMKGRRTDTEYETGRAVLYEFVDSFGNASTIEKNDRKHYLEISRGLWKGEEHFKELDRAYYITLFNFD